MQASRLLPLTIIALCATVLARNPTPFISQPLVPTSAQPGGQEFVLTINGGGFTVGSTVSWNGRALATSFVSSVHLTATVPASLIAKAGTASVTIRTPPRGGGSSDPVFFPVRRPVRNFTFQESSAGNPNDIGGNLVVADFNRDGILDFASFGSKQLAVSLGNGDGTFQSPAMFSWPCDGGQAVAADFNGDGLVDLAAVCGGVYIYLGNGDGTFQNPEGISTQTDNVALAAGDFNRDGKMDLVSAGSGVGGNDDLREVTVLLGNGDGTFQALAMFTSIAVYRAKLI